MQQTSAKRLQNKAQLGGKGDLLGILQEIEIGPYYQMVYTQSISDNEMHKIFWIT